MKTAFSLSLVAAAVALAACSEKPQVASGRKSDQTPYSTATNAYSTGDWKSGDATDWERRLNARTQRGQNEYGRTGPN